MRAFLRILILAIVVVLFVVYAYFWLDKMIKQEPDPRLPGLEEAARSIRKGLKSPPVDNIIRDGKG